MGDAYMIAVPTRRASSGSMVSVKTQTLPPNGSFGSASPSPAVAPEPGSRLVALVYAIPAIVATAALVAQGIRVLSRRRTPTSGVDLETQGPSPPNSAPPPGRAKTATPQQKPAPAGRFVKDRLIGRGAFGAVYRGMDTETGAIVAIKEMVGSGSTELRTEFELLQGLRHEHVVNVLGFEVVAGKERLYLEWVASGSLSDVLAKFGPVKEERLRKYTRQILLGLQFLHDNGILHRDIKPRNILVDHRGVLKLTDFGLSRHLDSINARTRACGTVVYMAPECLSGEFSVGSDIWAVGATIVELATGVLPWSHLGAQTNEMALMFKIGSLAGQRGHHPVIPPQLSPEGQDFLRKCFAPLPKDRGTCAELLQHPFLAGLAAANADEFPYEGSPVLNRTVHRASPEASGPRVINSTLTDGSQLQTEQNSAAGPPVGTGHGSSGTTTFKSSTATTGSAFGDDAAANGDEEDEEVPSEDNGSDETPSKKDAVSVEREPH